MQIIFTDGLGNEMFQYALYLAMRKRGRKPRINTSIITRNIVHYGFELCDDFIIERDSLDIVDGGRLGGYLTILAQRGVRSLFCYQEDSEVYSEKVFATHKPFVNGYWQDVRYFLSIANEVKRAFTFRNIDEANQRIGEEMSHCQSVAIHIRRGDYLKYPQYQVCTPGYYERSIKYFIEHIHNPKFYVFSDDLEWSDSFMKGFGVEYYLVGHNRGKDSYKDMFLMTRCKHNIIANSSFSWWGAWLGEQGKRIVICPGEWVKGSRKDPCPPGWQKDRVLQPVPTYERWGLLQILKKEYLNLNTGRRPALLFALHALKNSEPFRLVVLMRWYQNSNWRLIINQTKRKLARQYSVEIARTAKIGNNLRFHHLYGIVIGEYVTLGENCHVYQGVLLGQRNGLYPTIGNNVTLYPYCCVIGDVFVGDNSIVAAHSVVTHDVPPNCMVAGNPARVVKSFIKE